MLLTKRWRKPNDVETVKPIIKKNQKTFYLSGGYYYETEKNTL